MSGFENYKSNLDILDELCLNKLDVHNGVTYNGPELNEKNKCEVSTIQPLAAAVIGLNNTAASSSSLQNKDDSLTKWSNIDAQEHYLNKKPTCFMILGKPGVNEYLLGEQIAEKFNCIHLCPRNIIDDEIIQQSQTGKCLDFNMRHNNMCTFDVLLKILKKKTDSEVIKHRGYIISGFPMVTTNESEKYLFRRVHGEISMAYCNEVLSDILVEVVKKRAKEKKRKEISDEGAEEEEAEKEDEEEAAEEVEKEEAEEEEDQHIELPEHVLDACSNIIVSVKTHFDTQMVVLTKQFYKLMNLGIQPDIFFYTTCPDADSVALKNKKYVNCVDNSYVCEPLTKKIDLNKPRWPKFYSMFDLHSDNTTLETKYLCKQPNNFKVKAVQQLCNYNNYIYSFIEKTLQGFDPKRIIKLDGRLPVSEMMEQVSEKLFLLTIIPITIPKPLNIESEDLEEFWNTIGETNVFESDSYKFVRSASPWYNRCPVELIKRHTILGKTKYAATFLKYVYLLSSPENFIKFYINPRPYLKMKYLDPICRISVIGSKLSGKSMIASCLSWIFDTSITDVTKIAHGESIKKFNKYSLEIFNNNVKSLIDNERRSNWKNLESKRIKDLNDWFNEEKKQLGFYVSKFDEFIEIKKNKDDLIIKNEHLEKSLSLLLEDEEGENHEKQNKILAELKSNTNTITDLDLLIETTESELHDIQEIITYIPFLNELEMCRSLLTDGKKFKEYAPLPLITPTEKPKLPPLIDDEDVKMAIDNHIAQNEDLKKEIEIKTEEVVPVVIKILNSFDNDVDERTQQIMYGKWIVDNYPLELDHWVTLSENHLLPDITITLIEHREEDDDLMNIYTDVQNSVKYPEERYMAANDPLISLTLLRKPSGTSDVTEHNKIGEITWNDLLNRLFPLDFQSDQKEEDSVFAKFRENWEAIQLHLEENSKCFIEVEIGNKTDIEVVEEVLLKLRKCYYLPVSTDEEATQEDEEEEVEIPKNMLTSNPPTDSCETVEYCPIAFYKYGVLWKGKVEFNLKFDGKIHYFCDENSKTIFENDVTKYQSLNKPLKKIPALKICVIGRIGNGKSTISKQIAKELGLFHIDFSLFLNEYLLPKHYKKVGWKYENIFKDKPFDDEEVTTFEEPEEDEGLNKFPSEEELRLMVYKYFELGVPLYSKYIQKLIKILWFQEPYCTTGFVLDGFPKNQTDVECMIQNFCIPDLIIELQGDSEDSVQRVASEMFKTWKIQLAEAKRDAKFLINIENKKRDDFITKTVIGKLIFDDILDNVCASDDIEQRSSPIIDADPDGSTDVDSKLFNYYKQLSEEYPVPEDTTEWENADDARERIETRVQSIYEVEDENIETFKDMLQEEKIKIILVDTSKSQYKVLLNVLSSLSNLRNRNESFLEQTFIVDNDTADNMLLQGFYLLSNFGRMCPVYIYEHPYCIHNPFKSIKQTNEIFTVLNRSYIYYVFGKDNLIKFRNNPLKYILNNSMTNYCEYPLRISIIGPPKSGKSVLTAKLASRYGLMPISKGFALRYIMDYMPWTELALNMTKQLHSGECVNIEHIVQAIQVIALDYRVSSYGFILDGFPETTSEAEKLHKIGLNPLMVFDLGSSKNKILQNSQNEIHLEILKYMPTYSLAFCEHKFAMWNEQCASIRDWIKQDCDNLYNIDAEASRWLCLQSAIDNIDINIPKIHYFLKNENETAISMDVMAISNETFQQRMSNYKTFCPLCFSQNKLRHSGIYKGGKGKILYKNVFYWVCDEHKKVVMKHPHCYLAPEQNITFPEIPVVVSTINVFLVYENGVCIVTYAENLPSQTILRGDSNFAANYHGKIYLFCSHECLQKFLEKPHLYCDITVFKDIKLLPQLSLKTLPNLGYLEQTVGNVITSACCYVNVMRPKYPGLDIDMSGIILLALYLKIHNPLTSQSYLPLYVKANKTYEARCKLIHDVGLLLRSMDNPLAKYPVCCKGDEVKLTVMKSSSSGVPSFASASASRVPVPDERYDYLCQYHKPASKVPAFLNVVDIAGLVKGAAEGQGLGNAFLSHIKACDAIFNLCRAFEDEDVIHVDGEVNPVRDLETIGEELRLKDEEQLLQHIDKLDRQVNRGNDKKLKPEYDTLLKIKSVLVDEKKHIRFGDWSAYDIEVLNKYLFITSKPALYLVNLSEKDYIRKKNKWLPKLKEWIDKNDPGAPLIPFSGVLEYKLFEMEPAEKEAFLKEQNITSALDKIIVQGYKALQLEYFFTAGEDEVKAWTIQKGTKAPQAAGRIHTDFEKGFIMAEVMHFKDFKEEGSEAACKSAGKYRQQGRNYVVEDGDIIFFKFNAGAGLKDAKKK